MKNKLWIILLTAILSGCATQTHLINGDTVSEPVLERTEHFFIDGLGQKKTIDAATICGGAENVVKVQTEQTFINGVFDFMTFGIYTPRTSRVFCKG